MNPAANAPDSGAAPSRSAWRAILAAGAIAGTLDIVFVIVFYARLNVPAAAILRAISAGLLGPAARNGCAATAALGLALHFVIAFVVATTFYALSRRWRALVQWPTLSGLVFGAGVWLVMNLAVLPLSATPPKAFPPPHALPIFIAHLVCVGLPIAWSIRRWAR